MPTNPKVRSFATLAELDFELKAIPPTYGPPRSPPGGKPLTNRQKVTLAAMILITIFIVMLLGYSYNIVSSLDLARGNNIPSEDELHPSKFETGQSFVSGPLTSA